MQCLITVCPGYRPAAYPQAGAGQGTNYLTFLKYKYML